MKSLSVYILGLLLAGSLAIGLTSPRLTRPAAALQQEVIVALDMVTDGNGATTVGTIQACRSVDPGDTFHIDFVVQEAQDLAGFQVRLEFDPTVVEVVDRQADLFLGSGGLEAGDTAFPVRNGSWLYGYTNLPGQAGSGVVVRVGLKALAPGSTALSFPLGPLDTALIDSNSSYITVEGVIYGKVRVASDCTSEEITPIVLPANPQPTSQPGGPGSSPSGTPTTSGGTTQPSPTSAADSDAGPAADAADSQPGGSQDGSSGDGDTSRWVAVAGGAAGAAVLLLTVALAYFFVRRRRAAP